jgi:DNA-binding NtrC family response regulator
VEVEATVLVVDDEEVIRDSCRQALQKVGFRVVTAGDGFGALRAVSQHTPDVVLLDLKMPGIDGTDLLQRLRCQHPELEVVIITGYSSVGSAVECMRLGAYDYLPKPFDTDALRLVVGRAVEKRRLARENQVLRRRLGELPLSEVLLGASASISAVRELIERVAPSDATVLVLGESGTGKELVARAIHRGSSRREHPFVAVDCGALVETLCESELFGHARGAFTGAVASRVGRFEQASGGTAFLDEVGNVGPGVQGKLLRVLQEKEITRVGGQEPIRIDVRIIAATNQDLPALMADGRFREDLYYRLSVVTIEVPPLRAHREDISLLTEGLLLRLARRKALAPRRLAPSALHALQAHDWPGNVRELENTLERALVLAQGEEIRAEDLYFAARPGSAPQPPPSGDLSLAALEEQQIRRVLDIAGWRLGQAADLLGIDRKTLWRKIKSYGLR